MIDAAEVFLNTDLLLYAAMGREDATREYDIARNIILEENYATSTDVLGEFFELATSVGTTPLSSSAANNWVKALTLKPCQQADTSVLREAAQLSSDAQLPIRFARKLVSAERLGCRKLYAQNFPDGLTHKGVSVVNPFV